MLKFHKKLKKWNIRIWKSKEFQKYEIFIVYYKDLSVIKINVSYIHISIWKEKAQNNDK